MVNRLKPLNLFDFTGGVNLRPETFQLKDNEMPELLNMELDPRGGINTRKGWVGFGAAVPATPWNPRHAYAHTTSAGDRVWMVANQTAAGTGAIHSKLGTAGAWTAIAGNATAKPHLADFTSWGDSVYIVRGNPNSSVKWDNSMVTVLTPCAAANWQNDYAAPGSTDTFPYADLVEQSHGYMFVAGTNEDNIAQPNRIRWSHPNNPQRWAQADYIDIRDGGQRITALVAFSDRLLVFKPDSVWAVFGYDADTWEVANISRTVGCLSQQVCARNEAAVFFLSWPQGIFGYTDKGISELSIPIRTIFQDQRLDPDSINNSWMGWMGRRLWCSLPYDDTPPAPVDAATVFVFDPALQDPGSWMMFRGGDGSVPGPYMERTDADQATPLIAFSRQYPYLLQLESTSTDAADEAVPNTPVPFNTRFRTKWLDAGAPTWKKSWRRPDFLLRGMTFETTVNVQVFHDFDNYNAERSFLVQYTPDNFPATYTPDGDPTKHGFVWGDGTLYGGSDQTSSVERGGTMGRSGAVQVLCVGNPGVAWGLNGIIFKYVPRRFR
jgi:hypothetical protein